PPPPDPAPPSPTAAPGPPPPAPPHRSTASQQESTAARSSVHLPQGVAVLLVDGAGGRAGPPAVPGLLQRHPGMTDPADLARRDADDQGVVGDVAGDDGAGGDGRPGPDAYRGDAHRPGADRGPVADGDAHPGPVVGLLQGAVG